MFNFFQTLLIFMIIYIAFMYFLFFKSKKLKGIKFSSGMFFAKPYRESLIFKVFLLQFIDFYKYIYQPCLTY